MKKKSIPTFKNGTPDIGVAGLARILKKQSDLNGDEEKVSVPKDLLNRICGMVYATCGEQHRLNYGTDAEYATLVRLRQVTSRTSPQLLTRHCGA